MLIADLKDYEGRVAAHSKAVSEQLSPGYVAAEHEDEIRAWRQALRSLTTVRRVVLPVEDERFRFDSDEVPHGARLWTNMLALMATHAWLEQRNRELIELPGGGQAVVASADDYEAAYQIFEATCERSILNLSETHKKILDAMHRLQKELEDKSDWHSWTGLTQRKIAQAAGLSQSTVSENKTFLFKSAKLVREVGEGGLALVLGLGEAEQGVARVPPGGLGVLTVRSWWGGDDPPPSGSEGTDRADHEPEPSPNAPVEAEKDDRQAADRERGTDDQYDKRGAAQGDRRAEADDREVADRENGLPKAHDPPEWLFYWMQSHEFLIQYRGVAGQTDMAEYVSLRDQRRMTITLPPLEEQRAIAHILGTLDDKIELNRRMNETLEEMARAIFKSWFVDFEPVRAKAEGRDTGLPEHIANLFPDRFEVSGLGEIPAGWNVTPIGEAVRVVGGGTPSTKEPIFWKNGVHFWATPRDLSKLQDPILLDTERKVTDAGLAKISSGLLPAGTVLLSSRAPVGYLAIAQVPVSVNQGFIAMICEESLTNHYVMHWALSNMGEIEGRASGTTFQEISKKNFRPMLVLVPKDSVLAAFEEQASSIYDKITVNLEQSRTLAGIRDTLLPRLISGELRISNADRMIGDTMP
jgi:type I restriction enzyme S subunit